MMINKKFIGRYCDIINPCAILSYWATFFDDNNLPKDNRWKAGYEPKDLKNWKIIEVGENKYYQDGVFLLEKGNHVVIYDAENVRIKNIGILKYRIHSENYILFTHRKYLEEHNFPLENFSESFKHIDKENFENWSLIHKRYMNNGYYYILQKYFQGKNHRIIINGNYIRTYYFDFGDINNIWEANLWNSI